MPLPPPDHRFGAAQTPFILDILARTTRDRSDGALVAMAAAGLTVAIAVVVAWPTHWLFALPAAALGCLGGWGVTDRVRSELSASGSVRLATLITLSILRTVIGLLGVAALVGSILSLA